MEREFVKNQEGLHQSTTCQATKGDKKETLSKVGIPMLRKSKACLYIKYK